MSFSSTPTFARLTCVVRLHWRIALSITLAQSPFPQSRWLNCTPGHTNIPKYFQEILTMMFKVLTICGVLLMNDGTGVRWGSHANQGR